MEPIGFHEEVSRQRAQATGTGERRERGAQNGAHRLPRGGFTAAGPSHWDRRKAREGCTEWRGYAPTRRFHGRGPKPLGEAKSVRGVRRMEGIGSHEEVSRPREQATGTGEMRERGAQN